MFTETIAQLLRGELYSFFKEIIYEHHKFMCVQVGDYDLITETNKIYKKWMENNKNLKVFSEWVNDAEKICHEKHIFDVDDIINWIELKKTVDNYLPRISQTYT